MSGIDPRPTAKRWWETPKGDANKEVFNTLRNIKQNNSDRSARNLKCLRMYGNQDLFGVGPGSYMQQQTVTLPENRVKLNIVSAMVDTAGSKISKMKPKVNFLTSGGDWYAQRQGKQQTKFMSGLFYMNDVPALHQTGFRDAEIFDIGAIKHYVKDNKIISERVIPIELEVDPFDGLYGKPRNLYQYKYVSRSALAKMFPEQADSILKDVTEIEETFRTQTQIEDFVLITEAWHLPSSKSAKDGRHVICCAKATLVDEEYTKDYFPFTFFRWSKPVVGFFGQSLADRLTSLQIEINKILRIIQRSFHLGAAFKVFLDYGSKVSKEHLNNDIGALIYYSGKAPQYYVPQTTNPELTQHLKWLVQSAYEETGISQTSAAAKIPSGLDGASGRAIREYNNLDSERFALTSQEYERTFLETARIYMDLAKDIGPNFAVRAQSKKFIEEIKWGDVAPKDENAFVMQMFPVSSLPHEPAGRLAYVQELITSGMIPADFGLELLDFPDLEGYLNIKNAAIEDLLWTLEKLSDGEFIPPEPYQNLVSGVPFMQSAYLHARQMNAPEEVLQNIRDWINQATAMTQPPQPAQAQGAPAPQVPQNQPAAPMQATA